MHSALIKIRRSAHSVRRPPKTASWESQKPLRSSEETLSGSLPPPPPHKDSKLYILIAAFDSDFEGLRMERSLVKFSSVSVFSFVFVHFGLTNGSVIIARRERI